MASGEKNLLITARVLTAYFFLKFPSGIIALSMRQAKNLTHREQPLLPSLMRTHTVLLFSLLLVTACSVPPARVRVPYPSAGRATQTGIASWYGPGFHGQRTASGTVYNQYELTAAHPTLPLGTRVVVTNLNNGSSVEVAINDRGPYAKARIIDLSHAAADAIGMIGPGTAPVRIEVVDGPHRVQTIRESLDYTLQLGSFAELQNALLLRDRLAQSFSEVAVVPLYVKETIYYRVQMGTFSNRAAAEEQAGQVAWLGLPILIMEK
jgi:rare lipoprotein A